MSGGLDIDGRLDIEGLTPLMLAADLQQVSIPVISPRVRSNAVPTLTAIARALRPGRDRQGACGRSVGRRLQPQDHQRAHGTLIFFFFIIISAASV
eukprot:2690068-Rhodomonas_salina.3